jgi:hypothetical protein
LAAQAKYEKLPRQANPPNVGGIPESPSPMSDAFFHRSHALQRRERAGAAQRLPVGYGLAIGAGVSLGLWGGIIWLAAHFIG